MFKPVLIAGLTLALMAGHTLAQPAWGDSGRRIVMARGRTSATLQGAIGKNGNGRNFVVRLLPGQLVTAVVRGPVIVTMQDANGHNSGPPATKASFMTSAVGDCRISVRADGKPGSGPRRFTLTVSVQ